MAPATNQSRSAYSNRSGSGDEGDKGGTAGGSPRSDLLSGLSDPRGPAYVSVSQLSAGLLPNGDAEPSILTAERFERLIQLVEMCQKQVRSP